MSYPKCATHDLNPPEKFTFHVHNLEKQRATNEKTSPTRRAPSSDIVIANAMEQMEAERVSLARFQLAVLDALEHADTSEGLHLIMNPHLWRPADRVAAYKQTSERLRAWDSDWSVLKAFHERHPHLSAGDFCLAYHGAKNSNRVKHILLEGLDQKYRREDCSGPAGIQRGSFFGATVNVCKDYGDVVLFVIPKSACGKTRGDGAFQALEHDALPIATYKRPSGYNFVDLFLRTFTVSCQVRV